MIDFASRRRTMVDCQVRTYDVTDLDVIAALEEAPREKFVPAGAEALAYSDRPVAFERTSGDGARRVLLPPLILARLLQALALKPGETILDVGCATGYGVWLMNRLDARVVGLEADADLAAAARRLLGELGAGHVGIVEGLLAQGHAAGAPYDAILLNGAFEVSPDAVLEQLADGGRFVGIDARGRAPHAILIRRSGDDFSRRPLFDATAPVIEGLQRAQEFVF